MFVDCDFLNGIYYFDWMNNNLFVELTTFDSDECSASKYTNYPVEPASWMETNNNNNECLFALETVESGRKGGGGVGGVWRTPNREHDIEVDGQLQLHLCIFIFVFGQDTHTAIRQLCALDTRKMHK